MTVVMLPVRGGCPACGTRHEDDQPHNQQSLAYQYGFWGRHGRWPTWADAIAHCTPEVRAYWKQELQKRGKWSEPPEGVAPIAMPVGETLREPVDITESLNIQQVPLAPKHPKKKRGKRDP